MSTDDENRAQLHAIEGDWREAIAAISEQHAQERRELRADRQLLLRTAKRLTVMAALLVVVMVGGLASFAYQVKSVRDRQAEERVSRIIAITDTCEQTRGPNGTNAQIQAFLRLADPQLVPSATVRFPVVHDCAAYARRVVGTR